MAFLGFFAIEPGLGDAYGFNFRSGLSLIDPMVLGFIPAMVGFFISLSTTRLKILGLLQAERGICPPRFGPRVMRV